MKRPQSANQKRSYWPQVKTDDGNLMQEQGKQQYTRVQTSGVKNNMLPGTHDYSRLIPKIIKQDKQRLYSETLQLKKLLNEVVQQNVRLKTRVVILQREKERMDFTGKQADQQPFSKKSNHLINTSTKRNEQQHGIITTLKKTVRQCKQEIQHLNVQITQLKKCVRYTKINQYEIEKQSLYDENKRCGRIVHELREQLEIRIRQDETVRDLQRDTKVKNQRIKELTMQNMKYEEILETIEIKYNEEAEKNMVKERKWQRDLGVEKRRADQMGRVTESLKNQLKALQEKTTAEEQRRKMVVKKPNRPASSHPYRHLQSNKNSPFTDKLTQQQQALIINQKLNRQLNQARYKLKESENKLLQNVKSQQQKIRIHNLQQAKKDETIDFILTKNQMSEFVDASYQQKQDKEEKQEYYDYFKNSKEKERQTYKNKQKIYQKNKKQQVNNNESDKQKQSSNANEKQKTEVKGKVNERLNGALQEIREVLTYRMKYNRYPFAQIKQDIESSPLSSFSYTDLFDMLIGEPFFLTEHYAAQFLHFCYQKNKIEQNDELDACVFTAKLRRIIDDFQLSNEDEEESMLYRIAEFMTQYKQKIQQQFKKIVKAGNKVSKSEIQQVLGNFKQLTSEEIDLAICYMSISNENMKNLNYLHLIDKFYIANNSRSLTHKEHNPIKHSAGRMDELDLSLGDDQCIYEDQEDEDGQII